MDAWIEEHGSLDAYPDAQHVSNSDLLELPCDVLVLAALEDQVTADNAGRIDAKMVAEGANGPTTIEADAILAERGIVVLPDILTNAGGVTVSYFECRISVGCSGGGTRSGTSSPSRSVTRLTGSGICPTSSVSLCGRPPWSPPSARLRGR